MSAEQMWVESYQGEILGEIVFGALAEQEADAARRRELEVLVLLERATKELAEPVFERNSWDRGDLDSCVERSRFVAGASCGMAWEDFLTTSIGVASDYLGIYHKLADEAGTDWEKSIADAYVAHEEALISYFRRALGEEDGEPLERILALPHVVAATAH